jgi:hypothetical protein
MKRASGRFGPAVARADPAQPQVGRWAAAHPGQGGCWAQGPARGRGYGREALALLTDWLFEHAAAETRRSSDRSRQRCDADGLPASRLGARRLADRVRPQMGDVQNHPTPVAGTITPPPLPSLPPSQCADPPRTQSVIRQTPPQRHERAPVAHCWPSIRGEEIIADHEIQIGTNPNVLRLPGAWRHHESGLAKRYPRFAVMNHPQTAAPVCRGRVRQASRRTWRAGGAVHGAWDNTSRDLHAPALMAKKPAAQQGRGPSLVPGGLLQDGDPCHYRRGIVAESTSG